MKTNLRTSVAIALLLMTASAQALQPEVLYAFQLGPRGPNASLVQGSNGNFYGTTALDGSSDSGTVIEVTTNGLWNTLVSFNRTNGWRPTAGLALGSDGNFYGTTAFGGSKGFGTVFQVTTNGVLTTLVEIIDGWEPKAALVMGNDGAFYGTTSQDRETGGCGTVFKVTANGVFEITSLMTHL